MGKILHSRYLKYAIILLLGVVAFAVLLVTSNAKYVFQKNKDMNIDASCCQFQSIKNENGDVVAYALTGYNKNSNNYEEIVVPESWKGKPVTQIGNGKKKLSIRPDKVKLTIPNSVKTIAAHAFEECSNLTSITIPENVTTIGEYAFRYCYYLDSVEFATESQLTTIGECVFYGCGNLTSITIPKSVETIKANAFEDCGLAKVEFANGSQLATIGNLAFFNCDDLSEITIPKNVKTIGHNAFAYCERLNKVKFADESQLTKIGNNAFANCIELASVEFADEIQITAIEAGTFRDCSKLTSIVLPKSVTTIQRSAFEGCSGFKIIYYTETSRDKWNISIYEGNDYFEHAVCYYYSETEPDVLNKYWHYVNGVPTIWDVLPSEFTFEKYDDGTIAVIAYKGNEDSVLLPSTNWENEPVEEVGSRYTPEEGAPSFAYGQAKNITIPKVITKINDYAFQGSENKPSDITSITFADESQLTTIGGSAFRNCNKLTSITIPNSVTAVEENAFYNCTGMNNITIPSSNKITIGENAFNGCSGLEIIYYTGSSSDQWNDSITKGSGNDSLSADKIYYYSDTEPEAYDQYWRYVNGVPVIWAGPFTYEAINGGSTYAVTSYTGSDTSITIPITTYKRKKVTEVGSPNGSPGTPSFNCGSATDITILDDITKLNAYAFYGSTNLKSIVVSENVTEVGVNAFDGCNKLKAVYYKGTSFPAKWDTTSQDKACLYLETKPPRINKYWRYVNDVPTVWDVFPEEFTYEDIDDTTVRVIGYTGSETKITLPSVSSTGKTVTEVGKNIGVSNIAMFNYGSAEDITIPNSITKLNTAAFYGTKEKPNTKLKSITFEEGSNLQTIGSYAFQNCTSLSSLEIPNTVTDLQYYTFRYCTSLESVTFAEGINVNQIGSSVFSGCTALKEIEIPSSVTTILSEAFEGCTSLESATFEKGSKINEISTKAFGNCSELKSIELPALLYKLRTSVFENCIKLNSVTFAEGCKVDTIQKSTFQGCIALKEIEIPSKITWIANSAFQGSGLVNITFADGSKLANIGTSAFEDCTALQKFTMPSNVVVIGTRAFYNCSSLSGMVTVPEGIKSIGASMFENCSSLTGITIPLSATSVEESAFSGCNSLATVYYGGGSESEWNAINFGNGNSKLTDAKRYYYSEELPSSKDTHWHYVDGVPTVWNISPEDFAYEDIDETTVRVTRYNGQETSIAIPAKTKEGKVVTEIGNTNGSASSPAFYLGPATKITIPNSVTKINQYAFISNSYNPNKKIKSVTFAADSNLETIEQSAFYYTSLENITLPKSVTSIGESAFRECQYLANVAFEEGSKLKTIETYAFYHSPLYSIVIPSSVENIGDHAFYYDMVSAVGYIYYGGASISDWQNITIGSSNEAITKGRLYYYSEEVPQTKDQYWHYVDGVPTLWNVSATDFEYSNLSDGTVSVTKYNGSETRITLPSTSDTGKTVTVVGSTGRPSFKYGTATDITIPKSITKIQSYAFSAVDSSNPSTIERIRFAKDSNLQKIGSAAFWYVTNMSSIEIPDNVTTIEGYAFVSCTNLVSMNIPNNLETIGDYAFYNCSKWMGELVLPESVEWIGHDAFYNCSMLTGDLKIPAKEKPTTIKTNTFVNCKGLTSITIPDNVTAIESSAFSGCTGLTSIKIPDNVTAIGSSAFKGCSGLTGTLEVPSNVTIINYNTFENCSELTEIVLKGDVTKIDSYAFNGCSKLKSFTIPSTVTEISSNILCNCIGLTKVTISEGVKKIGYGMFYGCTGLTSIEIPSSVTAISSYAFKNCTSLKTVSILGNVTTIGEKAFTDIPSGSTIYVPSTAVKNKFNSTNYTTGNTTIEVVSAPNMLLASLPEPSGAVLSNDAITNEATAENPLERNTEENAEGVREENDTQEPNVEQISEPEPDAEQTAESESKTDESKTKKSVTKVDVALPNTTDKEETYMSDQPEDEGTD